MSAGAPLPLAGLRVVDFSRLLPGPYATLALADLGADVIKIEAPEGGDYLRWMPPLSGEVSHAFSALNSGKRSLAVDLKAPAGAALVAALAARADVVVESFRPGVMTRLGLGYDALSAVNPGLIYCALSGFGHDGPYAAEAGHDLNYASLAGVIGLGGPVDRPPALPPAQIADYGGSLWALVAVLSALHARHRSGEGAFLDVSMTEGALSFLTASLAPLIAGAGAAPQRGADLLTGGQPCYDVYATADGRYFGIAPLEPKFWASFCKAIGRPEWLKRQYGDAALRGDLEALFASRTRDAWEHALAWAGACCQPVLVPDELAEHPLHVARGNVLTDAAGHRRLRTPARPRAAAPPGPAPRLGEHSRAIALELGFDDADVARLVAAGVLLDGAG